MPNAKPALLLIILSPILAELLTASTPVTVFVAPATLALFLFLGYGIPVLLIREFAVRIHAWVGGLLTLGFAYGIYNEGLLAKTIIQKTQLPLNGFDNYGYVLGLSVPWMVVIGLWHATAAVLYPILICQMLFPAERQ